tara:strand:+ start:95 stop:385 length:291 start_codon:yes stop_codon:yes gene_type:complete
LSDKDLGKKKEAETYPNLVRSHPRNFPFTTQQQLTQRRNNLREREGLMQSVVLCDSDTLTTWAGEGSNLLAGHGSEDIFVPVDRIQERNFASVTLV